METNLYHSPIILPALALCTGVSLVIFSRKKDMGSFSLLIGFIIFVVSKLVAKFCTGVSMIGDTINNYPYLCNSVTPYIEGVAILLIFYGITTFVPEKNT